jgi:hypothetical protein
MTSGPTFFTSHFHNVGLPDVRNTFRYMRVQDKRWLIRDFELFLRNA